MQDFKIDRRPIAAINTYGGLYDQTPTGQSRRFYDPGGVDWLIEHQMEPMRELGYERFLIWLPAGSNRQRWMASAQWGPLPDYRKQEFEEILMPWSRETGVEIGVYMGYKIHDPYSLQMPELELRTPDLSKPEDREWFNVTVGNWNRIGCHWFVGDAATQDYEASHKIAQAFYAMGMKYGGEAFPVQRNPDTLEWEFNSGYENRMAWICGGYYAAARDPEHKWQFDPATSEMTIFFSGHTEMNGYPKEDEAEIRRRHAQGFVLSSMRGGADDTSKIIMDIWREDNKKRPTIPIPKTAYRPFKGLIANRSTISPLVNRKGLADG
tara:strand:- start:4079 stop:5047 length:969 start_codon:yes stop_codon:yes gene_type:complete